MNTIHDCGGMHGFGAVDPRDDAIFHADWEKRIAAILACSAFNGLSVFDENRRAAESMPPVEYLETPYFGRWLYMIQTLAQEKGVATRAEIAAGHAAADGARWSGPTIAAADVPAAFRAGGSTRADVATPPRFAPGDTVTVKVMHPTGHTRLPRYARGKRGTVVRLHGGFTFPDTRAHGQGDHPQHLYCVRFTARELWGDDAPARDSLCLDLWDSYLA